jgi:hypothetical protein
MTRPLWDINANTGTLTRASDAGAALILKRIAGLIMADPLDPDRRQLLDEIKGFENSLKGTVLDPSDDGKTAALLKSDQPTGAFFSKTIAREKSELKQAGGNESKEKTKVGQPEKKSELPENKGKKKISARQKKEVSIIKLKHLVVEEGKIFQILNSRKGKAKENRFNGSGKPDTIGAPQGPTDICPETIEKNKSERYRFEAWLKKRVQKLPSPGKGVRAKPPVPGGKAAISNKKYPGTKTPAHARPVTLDRILRQITGPDLRHAVTASVNTGSLRSAPTAGPVKNKTKPPVSRKTAGPFYPSGPSESPGPIDPIDPIGPIDPFGRFDKGGKLGQQVDRTLNALNRHRSETVVPPGGQQDPSSYMPQDHMPGQHSPSASSSAFFEKSGRTDHRTSVSGGVPDELKTAVQWMAEDEVENKLVEMLRRQAKLRGVDLS